MRLTFGTFLSRILVKARRHYLFAGVVIGEIRIGVIWPARKAEPVALPPELPGLFS